MAQGRSSGKTVTEALATALAPHGLMIAGICAITPDDTLALDTGSLAMISPDEPRFWDIYKRSPEATDGAPSPLDRWSHRILTGIATELGGHAYFPFCGPPFHPFLGWATRSGRVWSSPVGLLVHDVSGLFISFRGAILTADVAPPTTGTRPCDSCAQPCRTACPVGALGGAVYDVPRCKSHIVSPMGRDCLTTGCAVRRACPVGQERRDLAQSAFHMKAFVDP